VGHVRRFLLRLANLLRHGKADAELDRELSSHLMLLEDEFRRRGLPDGEARLAARRAFGGIEQTKDRHRDARSFRWVDELTRDVRYGARLLRRNPLFTITAAASLAVAIGAGTTVFTAANALLLRTAPGVADPGRLVDINRSFGDLGVEPIPYSMYLEIRDRATLVDHVYAYELNLRPMSLTGLPGQAVAEAVFADRVSPNYFTALGVSAVAGRLFGEQDASDLVVLSDRFWRRRFNADGSIIGGAMRLNDRLYTIVGVAAGSFHGNTVLAPDLWTASDPARPLDFALVGARLKPGTSRSQAAAEVAAIGQNLRFSGPDILPDPASRRRPAPRLTLSRSSPVPTGVRILVGGFLGLLMAIVAVLLTIASANVAGVLLARATARRREIGIRLALGVGRAQLVRQLLTETILLFGLGGLAGLGLSRVMNAAMLRMLPSFPLPADAALSQDGRVVAFALGVSLVAALAFGLTPALQASNVDVTSTLKTDEQGPSRVVRVRRAFVVAQIALSVLLAVVGGLLSRALLTTGSPALGFDPRGVESVSVDLSLGGYTRTTGATFARELLGRIRQMPDVDAAAIAYATPVGGVMGFQVSIPGETAPEGRPFYDTLGNIVTPGYLAAMRIGLAAGREFSDADSSTGPRVAILSETAVRRFWRGIAPDEAVGKQITLQPMLIEIGTRRPAAGVPLTVVGVAHDLTGVNGRTPRPFIYLPLEQRYISTLKILTRTTTGQRIAREVRSLVTTLDPRLPVLSAGTLDDEGSPVMTQLRLAAVLAGSLGICGLLLAAMGIYGLTAYLVTRRTREIGVRIALGAERADLIRMVLAEGMWMVLMGSAVGLLLAAGASRLLTSLLFGVPPLDPLTFGGVIGLFAAIALAASYGPLRRALRINPVEALRYE
jgi:predicted permease